MISIRVLKPCLLILHKMKSSTVDIGSFDIYDYDFESNTKSLVLGFASFNNNAPLYKHFEEILAYAELNQLDNSYLATQLTTLIPGSDFAKVETAFTLTNYDDIFQLLNW